MCIEYLNIHVVIFQEAKRKAVEQKLEMKARQEQENIKKERRKLFLVKQKKEQKIRRLEQKVELVKIVSVTLLGSVCHYLLNVKTFTLCCITCD